MKMTPARRAAKGQICTLRLPGICNSDPETTVLAHIGRHGTAKRNHDEDGVFACSDCHDAIDLRTKQFLSNNTTVQEALLLARTLYIEDARKRTKKILLEMGIG